MSNSIHSSTTDNESHNKAVFGPGDNKQGYESSDYKTNSLDIQKRTGQKANLLEFVEHT